MTLVYVCNVRQSEDAAPKPLPLPVMNFGRADHGNAHPTVVTPSPVLGTGDVGQVVKPLSLPTMNFGRDQ